MREDCVAASLLFRDRVAAYAKGAHGRLGYPGTASIDATDERSVTRRVDKSGTTTRARTCIQVHLKNAAIETVQRTLRKSGAMAMNRVETGLTILFYRLRRTVENCGSDRRVMKGLISNNAPLKLQNARVQGTGLQFP